jgi:hypothetical protein
VLAGSGLEGAGGIGQLAEAPDEPDVAAQDRFPQREAEGVDERREPRQVDPAPVIVATMFRNVSATTIASTVWRKKNGVVPMKTPTAMLALSRSGLSWRWSTAVTRSRARRQEKTT